MSEPIGLTVLTGFLGSGKTTLLRRYLDARPGRVGVVVNEYGEIGLDHVFFVHAAEHLELMAEGCLCCARRTDIAAALHRLIRHARGTGAGGIDSAVIETSGIADPAPIIATISQDPWLRNNVRLRAVVAVLDAVNALDTLARAPEAVRQVAMADVVVVSKSDMRAAADPARLAAAIRAQAPDVPILDAQDPGFDIAAAIEGRANVAARVVAPPAGDAAGAGHGTQSFVLRLDRAIDWPVFTVWLSALLHRHGDRILRVKGIVTVASTGKPLVIHGVQHVMYPPVHLEPDDARDQPRGLVFITAGIGQAEIEASLHRFLDAAGRVPLPGVAAS